MCGGEGAERTAGGGVLDLPSPSDVGPEPLRTEPSRSANFVAAGFRREGGREGGTWETAQMELWPLRQAIHSAKCEKKVRFMKHKQQRNPMYWEIVELHVSLELKHKRVKFMLRNV